LKTAPTKEQITWRQLRLQTIGPELPVGLDGRAFRPMRKKERPSKVPAPAPVPATRRTVPTSFFVIRQGVDKKYRGN
jgi:hypothetical protein